jgi:hypothetical protein
MTNDNISLIISQTFDDSENANLSLAEHDLATRNDTGHLYEEYSQNDTVSCKLQGFFEDGSVLPKITLPIFAFGAVGNLLCIVTLLNKRFRKTSTGFILLQMALLDIALQIIMILLHGSWLLGQHLKVTLPDNSFTCPLRQFIKYYPRQMSALAISMLTVERVISVYNPLHCKRVCSLRRIAITYVVGALSLALINSHVLIWIHKYDATPSGNVTYSRCSDINPEYAFFYSTVWLPVSSLFEVFIPAAFLVLGNSAIIAKMLRRRATLGQQMNSQHGSDVTKMTSMTVMFVVESVLFLLLNVPNEIFKLGDSTNFNLSTFTSCRDSVLSWMSTLLIFVGPSLNFLVYMVAGGKFRAAFRETFGGLLRSIGELTSRAWRRISGRIC